MGTVPMKVHWFLIKKLADQIQSHVIAMATDPATIELLAEDEKTASVSSILLYSIVKAISGHIEDSFLEM